MTRQRFRVFDDRERRRPERWERINPASTSCLEKLGRTAFVETADGLAPPVTDECTAAIEVDTWTPWDLIKVLARCDQLGNGVEHVVVTHQRSMRLGETAPRSRLHRSGTTTIEVR